ncbi:MAG TPA: CsiV family protein [Pseudomonadales bacterium]|nr:CsiV family protein [Pseudomonadales bacterium]
MADRSNALQGPVPAPLPRLRTLVARPLAAALFASACVLSAQTGAAPATETETPPEPLPWYQVEVVLFAQDEATAVTDENLAADETPVWPPHALALKPVYPEPIRPETLAELAALWNDALGVPQLLQVTPGLLPEDELFIRWLRREVHRGHATGMEWQDGLETLTWTGPMPTVEPDPTRAAAGTTADVDPNAQRVAGQGEEPAADAGDAAAAGTAGVDGDEAREPPAPEDIPIPMTLAFREVAPDGRLLDGEVRRLERAAGMRVLARLAWRQPFEADAPGREVRVLWRDPVDGEPALVGTVAIDLRRFLHARLNLYWRMRDADGMPLWTHIQATRRMRSSELHYIDHPQIGTLIRIEPFMLAEPLTPEGPVVAAPRE